MSQSKRDEMRQKMLAAKTEWERATVLLQPEEKEEPLLDGWSVKDVMAHLMWHENEMLGVLRAKRLVGSDLWNQPLDERNRQIWEQYRDIPVDELREQARNTFEALYQELEDLTDEDLTEPGHWPGMPDEWTLWQLLAGNTFEHYQDHTEDLRAFLTRMGRSAEIFPE